MDGRLAPYGNGEQASFSSHTPRVRILGTGSTPYPSKKCLSIQNLEKGLHKIAFLPFRRSQSRRAIGRMAMAMSLSCVKRPQGKHSRERCPRSDGKGRNG